MDQNQAQNTEQNNAVSVPDGVRGWNWGAFLMGIIWAIANRVWSMAALWGGLLVIDYALLIYAGDRMPFAVSVVFSVIFGVLSVVLGIKGNEWAWHDRKWDSVEQFRETQRSWTKWGVIVTCAAIIIGTFLGLSGILTS